MQADSSQLIVVECASRFESVDRWSAESQFVSQLEEFVSYPGVSHRGKLAGQPNSESSASNRGRGDIAGSHQKTGTP